MPTPTLHAFRKTFVASLWLGVLGAPLVWGVHLQLLYSFVKVAERTHQYAWLYLTTGLCALASAGCAVLSWRDWRAIRGSPQTTESSDREGRSRFLSVLGMFSGAFFTLVILATGLAVCFLYAGWD